jgi:murein DD-endopeptidase MepM/ murein hydrolase activator NlpD
MKNKIILLALFIFIIGCVNNELTKAPDPEHEVEEKMTNEVPVIEENDYEDSVPTGLSIPFDINDINPLEGEVNPLGIVRFSKDQSDVGHPGIDIPLKQGSSVYAVDDGRVVLIDSASDPWNGMKVFQLLKETGKGTGWAYNYEHIKLAEGVEVGSELKKGDLVGTKAAPDGFTAHFQLSKVFNDFKYTSDAQCWPDFLISDEKTRLDSWWEEYSSTQHLINSWDTTFEEDKYPFRGLLDVSRYPSGPQLCYSLGTDVR